MYLVARDLEVSKANRAKSAQPVLKEFKGLRATKVFRAFKVSSENAAFKAREALLAQPEQPEVLVD
jgi:hypothetical protein